MHPEVTTYNIEGLKAHLNYSQWNGSNFMVFSGKVPAMIAATPARRHYYLFLFVERGMIQNTIDFKEYTFGKYDLLYLKPNQTVEVKFIRPNTYCKLVAFESTFLDVEFHNRIQMIGFLGSPRLSLNKAEAGMFFGYVDELKKRLIDPSKPFRESIARSLINAFLFEIEALYAARSPSIQSERPSSEYLLNEFLNLVSAHFATERKVKYYASRLNIKPGYLSALTRQYTGKTPGQLIDEAVLLESKLYLKHPAVTIKQVAEALHFSDQFSFSKYFKKLEGISPSEYRLRSH